MFNNNESMAALKMAAVAGTNPDIPAAPVEAVGMPKPNSNAAIQKQPNPVIASQKPDIVRGIGDAKISTPGGGSIFPSSSSMTFRNSSRGLVSSLSS